MFIWNYESVFIYVYRFGRVRGLFVFRIVSVKYSGIKYL